MTTLAPIIVTAVFGTQDFAWLDDLRRRHYPADRNRVPAHLTLFRHLAPDLAPELKRRLAAVTRGQSAPRGWIAGVLAMDGGVALRVESPELEAIRADLAEAFGAMLIPQDRAGWRPHVTVQNKAAPADARALRAQLAAEITRRPLVITGLAAWHYRGGPWEPLSRHMFA
ncbi:2'-5' RNA ligase family protein [Sphingomonas sp. DT-204]|uniref:2'-5' RNA ligase family protein n=1 Tax=Sphingomonas sp. DT-204 TaxID=3396166 RepID=UPI003F1B8BCD